MNIIFLDFDGVIRVPLEDRPGVSVFSPSQMELVKICCENFKAKIVVTSDWRYVPAKNITEGIIQIGDFKEGNLEEVKSHIAPHLHQHLHKDWSTPIKGQRWKEVQSWLDDHPEVKNYVILEDVKMHFQGCPNEMARKLVFCDWNSGFIHSKAEELYDILEN